jgi:hypothetical protein
MLVITKRERDYLERLGYKFGSNNILHKSYSKHPTYYATEKAEVIELLKKYRENGG